MRTRPPCADNDICSAMAEDRPAMPLANDAMDENLRARTVVPMPSMILRTQ